MSLNVSDTPKLINEKNKKLLCNNVNNLLSTTTIVFQTLEFNCFILLYS